MEYLPRYLVALNRTSDNFGGKVNVMKIVLYGNGGSGNHGCEAIVRGTFELLREPFLIASESVSEDKKYGLEEFGQIYEAKTKNVNKIQLVKAYAKLKLTGNYTEMDGIHYLKFIKQFKGKADFALSLGGDNYCYSNQSFYAFLNRAYRKKGFKTVLWGCSIEPDIIKNEEILRDLNSYSLIVTRESITYNAVKAVCDNVILNPDPAFFMPAQKCELDERFNDGNVVGINISPMIISNEKNTGVTYENYKNLVNYILKNTDMSVAFIPHVVWSHNNDKIVLQRLYEDFDKNPRLILIGDYKAPELKYIISKCRLFIGARTHATIAAYSSKVPTLVVGYSVKAQGIALDLFGTYENYVIPVQSLKKKGQLTEAFIWLAMNEKKIRMHLEQFIPQYIKAGREVKNALEKI